MKTQKIEFFRKKLRQIERIVEEQLKNETECCGVSTAQCHAILEIGLLKTTTLKDLSESLNLDKSTLSRTVDGLVKAGYVERIADPSDRRFVRIKLSDEGKRTFNEINCLCNSSYSKVFDYIPVEKHEQVIESVVLLINAMMKSRNEEPDNGSEFLSCK